MVIVWDEVKRAANIRKHGIDFADLDDSFFARAVIRPARHGRLAAFGYHGGPVAVIFASLGREGISIVSARTANRKERMLIQ